MAEYQNTTVSSGEMTQRFIEFVMMQAQNAAFTLGQIPHPQTGKAEVNLDMAQVLIDQLAMIQEKTKGNLNADESKILAGAISNLQLAFVEAIRKEPSGKAAVPPEASPRVEQKPAPEPEPEQSDSDGKKKFVKSYGS
ncbi:MAG: DUF1844 domain-containing protein [Verrucomicrobia bacterium]|nr:DUF1844 domain-containing protein [Verrucomicrobiota bacterium]MBV9299322.1 DUF1844 domain-containing protein [Verrucomicrobiota bacterium]MBV9644443.1 DUF1844 domain-containing protein [Verrucomicrobiota bacterium]